VAANAAMLYAFGALMIPLQEAFGWTRGQLQPGMSFLFGGAVLAAQLAGWFNHRYGMRTVTIPSLIALAATFALMTLMGRSIGWFYLLCALLPIAGLGTMHITWTHLINLWFERNRGLALALMLSGTGLSAVFIPSGVTWAIAHWGWQGAFVLLAALPVVLALPLTLKWFETPDSRRIAMKDTSPVTARIHAGMDFRDAMRSPRFWTLNIALVMIVGATVVMITNTVPLLRDKGLSAAEASHVFGGFGLALIVGRVLVGYLIDRIWAPGVAAIALALPALGCLLLSTTGVDHTTTLVIATALLGMGAGAEFDIAAYMMARYFGLKNYSRLFGVHVGLITTASALAPWAAGAIYTATGTYGAMLAICGTAFLLGALMLLPMGRYPKFELPSLAQESTAH
jgi:predicted MFS family arabinose efflux permease